MTPETKAKNKLRKELKYLADAMRLPISVVANPASEMSEPGRADCDVIINNVLYLHCEIKREGNNTLDAAQAIIAQRYDYGKWYFTVVGESGVDELLDHLNKSIPRMIRITVKDLNATAKLFTHHYGDYLQERRRRQRIAARRPERQSSKVPREPRRRKKD